jgi:hypothetical protein
MLLAIRPAIVKRAFNNRRRALAILGGGIFGYLTVNASWKFAMRGWRSPVPDLEFAG